MNSERATNIKYSERTLKRIPYRPENILPGLEHDVGFDYRQNLGYLLETERNEEWIGQRVRDHASHLISWENLFDLVIEYLPGPMMEHFIELRYANKEQEFDSWLQHAARGYRGHRRVPEWDHWNMHGRAKYSRWVCVTTAVDLKRQVRDSDPRLNQSLVLTARRAIKEGDKVTRFIEGVSIDREWLSGIMGTIMSPTENLNLVDTWRFIDCPPLEFSENESSGSKIR